MVTKIEHRAVYFCPKCGIRIYPVPYAKNDHVCPSCGDVQESCKGLVKKSERVEFPGAVNNG